MKPTQDHHPNSQSSSVAFKTQEDGRRMKKTYIVLSSCWLCPLEMSSSKRRNPAGQSALPFFTSATPQLTARCGILPYTQTERFDHTHVAGVPRQHGGDERMNLKCRLGAHNWSKDCEKCSECGKTRSNFHTWKGFACVNCGHEQYSAAEMKQRVFRAAQNSDLETVNALLEHKPDLVSVRDNDGNTPLGIAAAEGHKEIAETLLSNAAEINSTNSKGFTPLHCAATLGRTEVVRLLLTKKAEVNPRDKGGATPLHFAAFAGHQGAAELLLANGAEVNVTDKENVTPLIKAVLQG